MSLSFTLCGIPLYSLKKAPSKEKSKMTTEAVFWYIIRTIFGIASIFTSFIVLKYLNKKTLAMRTIFDETIKDYIYLKILDGLSNVVMDIVVNFVIPLDNYVALLIIISRQTIVMAGIFQLIATMIIRYLYVFKQTLLNNEILVIFVTRLLVGCTAITTTLTGDLENMVEYCLITGKKMEDIISRPILIPSMIALIVLIITEYKIDKFRKSVDSQEQFYEVQAIEEEEEEEEKEERNCTNYCRKYSLRVVIGILSIHVLCTILYIVNFASQENLDIVRLRRISIIKLVIENIIPFVLIVRNQKLFCFFKAQILTILKLCKLRKNQIEPIELNVL